MSFDITIPGGERRTLKTGGKYCPDDIMVTAESDFTPPTSEVLTPEYVYKTTRPADWLPMPVPGDDEIYLLGHFLSGLDEIFGCTITYGTNCTADFGRIRNGIFVSQEQILPVSGNRTEHKLLKENYADETADGRKQYMVRLRGDISELVMHKESTTQTITHVVDSTCGIALTKMLFGDNDYRARSGTLQYLRFFGNGGVSGAGNFCSNLNSLKCVSAEKPFNVRKNAWVGAFARVPALQAISDNLIQMNEASNMAFMFAYNCALVLPSKCVLKGNNMSYAFYETRVRVIDGSIVDTREAENFSYFAYGSAYGLEEVKDLNISSATNFESAFDRCYMLGRITFSGETTPGGYTINLTGTNLNHDALVEMIKSLPVATNAANIAITGNPGLSELSDAEIDMATTKNWTIII